MNREEAKKRLKKLRAEINHHRYLYHVLDQPGISDAAWDSLKNELAKLEARYPEFITPDSPTQRVGGRPLAKFKKVTHFSPMMSLFDAFSEQDMHDWEERTRRILGMSESGFEYYCELKLDGLAGSLRYEKGIFVQGSTRGNGRIGEDVTQNLRTIESIPLSLRFPAEKELKKIGLSEKQSQAVRRALRAGVIEARGEAVMSKKVWRELNRRYKKEGKPLLANPRNGAAGSIRQLDPKLAAERKLDFVVYALATDFGLTRHEQEHRLAVLLGFKVLKENKLAPNLEEAINFHHYWEKRRQKLPFECDGVVVNINDLRLWPRLGIVGKGPRYVMAYKFAAEQMTTGIKEVVWQVGRTGIITPIAVLKPVGIGGVIVSHATLHNMDEIRRLGIKIGDTVVIERSGDVIPKVVKVLPRLREGGERGIKAPAKCPVCGSVVVKAAGEVAYRCPNKDCYAVNLRRLIHWAGKGALDIEGLGPKIIEQLVKDGLVSDIGDFYRLTAGDLRPLERFADKSAENLIRAIADSREVDLARFIYGLGIRHVGEETALLIADQFSLANPEFSSRSSVAVLPLLKYFQKLNPAEWEKLPDIGPIVAQSIHSWFQDKKNIRLLEKLEQNGLKVKIPPIKRRNRPLKGKTIVLTGALAGLTRKVAKAKIREAGGNVSSAVSVKTDYVVAGSDPGSKYAQAKKLGVKIIGEKEFLEMI